MGVAMANTPRGRRGDKTSAILSKIHTLRCANWGCYIDHVRFFSSVNRLKQVSSGKQEGLYIFQGRLTYVEEHHRTGYVCDGSCDCKLVNAIVFYIHKIGNKLLYILMYIEYILLLT